MENPEWTFVACDTFQTAALNKKGEVYSWGHNGWDQLGHSTWAARTIPIKVEGLEGIYVITEISCGDYMTAVVTDKGEVLIEFMMMMIF